MSKSINKDEAKFILDWLNKNKETKKSEIAKLQREKRLLLSQINMYEHQSIYNRNIQKLMSYSRKINEIDNKISKAQTDISDTTKINEKVKLQYRI